MQRPEAGGGFLAATRRKVLSFAIKSVDVAARVSIGHEEVAVRGHRDTGQSKIGLAFVRIRNDLALVVLLRVFGLQIHKSDRELRSGNIENDLALQGHLHDGWNVE